MPLHYTITELNSLFNVTVCECFSIWNVTACSVLWGLQGALSSTWLHVSVTDCFSTLLEHLKHFLTTSLFHTHTHTRTFMYAKWVCASTFRLTFTHRSNSGFSICLMQPGDQTFHRRKISRHPALPPKPQSPGSCHMYFFVGFLWESEQHSGLVNRRKVRRIERFPDVHRHHTSDPQLTCQWPVSVRGLCVCVY